MVEGNSSSPLTPAWPLSYVEADVSQWLGNSWQLTKRVCPRGEAASSKLNLSLDEERCIPCWGRDLAGARPLPRTCCTVPRGPARCSFPLRSRSVYRRWRVGRRLAASGPCTKTASAKPEALISLDVIGKHIILEFMCALHRVSSLKS